jgi:hypothetical protein
MYLILPAALGPGACSASDKHDDIRKAVLAKYEARARPALALPFNAVPNKKKLNVASYWNT